MVTLLKIILVMYKYVFNHLYSLILWLFNRRLSVRSRSILFKIKINTIVPKHFAVHIILFGRCTWNKSMIKISARRLIQRCGMTKTCVVARRCNGSMEKAYRRRKFNERQLASLFINKLRIITRFKSGTTWPAGLYWFTRRILQVVWLGSY